MRWPWILLAIQPMFQLYVDPYGQIFSVSCILWDKCGEGFAFKQLYCNYYWCLQTTRQIKDSRVFNKIEWKFVIIVGDLNINLLDPIDIENDFINNCHSNSLIHLINKPTRNANNTPSTSDHIWTNQLCDTFNGIFFIRYNSSLYPIFIISPINCPQKRISEKFRDHWGLNLDKLKI